MPVRSLNSAVTQWPDRESVVRALAGWAEKQKCGVPGIVRIGYCGSYAAGNWGVGSDIDIIVIMSETGLPFEQRSLQLTLPNLPVPADIRVYTESEWHNLRSRAGKRMDVVWLKERRRETGDKPFP